METAAHRRLKQLAMAYLRQRGCRNVATEVRCPISRYRVDVAGYQDCPHDARDPYAWFGVCPEDGRTFIIECKQSREDFLRDCEQLEALLGLRNEYEAIRRSIEEHRVKVLEPQLRRDGTSLFSELDEWDFVRSRLRGYRKVLRTLRLMDEKLHGGTKFFMMARYRLADELFIAAPCGMVRERELPQGWGLLEYDAELHDTPASVWSAGECKVAASALRSPRGRDRLRLLRNISIAMSRKAEVGVRREPGEF